MTEYPTINFMEKYKSESTTPESNYPTIDFVQKYGDGQSTIPKKEEEDRPIENIEIGEYSASDLVDDRFYGDILKYMEDRYAIDETMVYDSPSVGIATGMYDLGDYSRKDIVNMFLNNMRGFSGGNSVRAVNEIAYLNSLDPEREEDKDKLVTAGRAYTLFEGMETLFGNTDGWEKLDILADYTRQAILDPTNLIGFGLGKWATAGGSKVATRLAQLKAKQLYKKELKKQLEKGVKNEVAQKAAKKKGDALWARTIREAAKKEKDRLMMNRVKKNSKEGFSFRPAAWNNIQKEVAANTGVEFAAAVGTDIAYQEGLIKTTDKETINFYQTGLAAIGSMIFGGVQGSLAARAERIRGEQLPFDAETPSRQTEKVLGTDELALPTSDIQTKKTKKVGKKTYVNLSDGLERITESWKKHVGNSGSKTKWREKVKAGKDLAIGDFNNTFFSEMLLGNDEKGLIGLAQILEEQGFTWSSRYSGDNVSDFIADVIKQLDPQDVKKFFKNFEKRTGITLYTSLETGKKSKLTNFTPEDFSNAFANWSSTTGYALSNLSRLQKILNLDSNTVSKLTNSDYMQIMFDVGLAQKDKYLELREWKDLGLVGKVRRGMSVANVENLRGAQNKIIRLLVSAPSTSFYNVIGYGAASTINSATDIALGLTYLPQAALEEILFRTVPKSARKKIEGVGKFLVEDFSLTETSSKESLRKAKSYFMANIQRVRNLLSPNMTADAYRALLLKHSEALAELGRVLPGGIEDLDKIIKNSGFNPDQNLLGVGADAAVDYIQFASLVKLQDVFTKSQEMTYQLDKNLRLLFDMGWTDFYSSPDATKMMATTKYKQALATASEETLISIFSKSYKGAGPIGEAAGILEDARNIPGVGILVPFGRFTNNTVAFSMTQTSVAAFSKLMNPEGQRRTLRELGIRGAQGLALLYSLAQDHVVWREQGKAWDNRPDEPDLNVPFVGRVPVGLGTGATEETRYKFPVSHYDAAGRIWSYYLTGEKIPSEEWKAILDVVSLRQLTRTLDQTIDGLGQAFMKVVQGDVPVSTAILNGIARVAAQVGSASLRFASPYNDTIGLFRGKDFAIPNRKEDKYSGQVLFNNFFRYTDQFIGGVTGDPFGTEERFSASMGKIRNNAAKHLSMREANLNYTTKVMNIVGKPNFLADAKTRMAVAGNRYNEIFHMIVEAEAEKMWRDKGFREGDWRNKSNNSKLDIRRDMVRDMLEEAKKTTMDIMKEDYTWVQDGPALAKMMELEDSRIGGLGRIDKAIDDLKSIKDPDTGIPYLREDLDFQDLNLAQLELLETYLEYESDVRKFYTAMRKLN